MKLSLVFVSFLKLITGVVLLGHVRTPNTYTTLYNFPVWSLKFWVQAYENVHEMRLALCMSCVMCVCSVIWNMKCGQIRRGECLWWMECEPGLASDRHHRHVEMSLWWTIISSLYWAWVWIVWACRSLSFIQSQVSRHWGWAHSDINHGLRQTWHHWPLPTCPVKSIHQCCKKCSYSAYIIRPETFVNLSLLIIPHAPCRN